MSDERGPRGIEWTLLAVMAAICGFSILATGGYRAVDFAIMEYLMAGALGLSVVRLWVHRKAVFHVSPVIWAVLAFVAYVTVRFATADIHYLAEDEWTRVLFYAAFLIIFAFHLFRPQYGQTLLVVIAALAVFSSLYAAYQYFSGSREVWNFIRPANYGRRGSGTFINPNNFSGFVAVLLPMMVSIMLVARVGMTTRFVAGYAALMFLLGIAVAASRGGVLAAAGGMLALVFLLVRQRAFRMPALVILAVVLLGGFVLLSRTTLAQSRLEQMQTTRVEHDGRYLLWQSAEEMWRDHLWAGVGPGHYDAVFPQYRPETLQQRKPLFAHNEYLNTLADYGLIGALLVLVAIGAAEFGFRHGWKQLRRDTASLDGARSNRLALLAGAAAGFTGSLVHALFDFNYHLSAYALLMVFLLGIMTVAWRTENSRWWWEPGMAGKVVITLVSLALAGWFGWHGFKRSKEAQFLSAARKAPITSPERLTNLEAAWQVEPKNGATAHDIGEYHLQEHWRTGNNGDKAAEWLTRAARLHPHDSYNALHHAFLLLQLERPKEVEPYLKEAERLNPKDYYTLAEIGVAYYRLRNYREAIQYFERSVQLRPYDNQTATEFLPLVRILQAQQAQQEQLGKEAK